MRTKIDVIIPVYNRAYCLVKMVEELNQQTFSDFCAIFVDDGSTDNSLEVLRTVLPEQAHFAYRIITKENGGAASARNAGLRASTAPWIGFVDSDDGIHPRYLEYLYHAVADTDSDLAICYYQMFFKEDRSELEPVGEACNNPISAAECMRLYCNQWFGVYCLLIRGTMQRQKNIYFDEACRYCEDAPFITEIIAAANKVIEVKNRLYYYYANQGSLSRSGRVDKFLNGIEAFRRMEDRLNDEPTEAARVFFSMGIARYYIAVYRKAAVQLPYREYCRLARAIPFKPYRKQVKELLPELRLASYLLLFSKTVFYYAVRVLFKD